MKNLFSAKALAAFSMVVAFPLVASANSASLEKTYERLHQPLNTGTSNEVQRDSAEKFTYKVEVNTGGSYAMNKARQRVQEQTKHSTSLDSKDISNPISQSNSEALPHGRDW